MSVLKTYRRLTGERPTSVTYQLDLENKRLGRRMCDSVEAINQAIFLILAVERFDYKIYSYDYGVELAQDDRIKGTRDYTYTFDRESVVVDFTVDTISGAVPIERRFNIGNQVPSIR